MTERLKGNAYYRHLDCQSITHDGEVTPGITSFPTTSTPYQHGYHSDVRYISAVWSVTSAMCQLQPNGHAFPGSPT